MVNKYILGVEGEVLAKNFLAKNGYKILETNFTNHIGEIDIIAKQKDVIVFVEVKTRSTARFGYPREAVTEYKQQKIRKVALGYLKFNRLLDSKCRFDCIEVLDGEITHIKNCF